MLRGRRKEAGRQVFRGRRGRKRQEGRYLEVEDAG
jgi:hypothetical protein